MTTLTSVKQVTFEKVMQHFAKFVSKSASRPALMYVHFDGMHFTATNTHVLIKVAADYISDIPAEITENSLYCPKEMKLITEKYRYPDTSRLIPDYQDIPVILDKKNINDFMKQSKEVGKARKERLSTKVKLEFTDSNTKVSSDLVSDETEKGIKEYSKIIESVYTQHSNLTVHVNYNYLRIALEATKELMKVSDNQAMLYMTSAVRPLYIKSFGIFNIILLPIRIA